MSNNVVGLKLETQTRGSAVSIYQRECSMIYGVPGMDL